MKYSLELAESNFHEREFYSRFPGQIFFLLNFLSFPKAVKRRKRSCPVCLLVFQSPLFGTTGKKDLFTQVFHSSQRDQFLLFKLSL